MAEGSPPIDEENMPALARRLRGSLSFPWAWKGTVAADGFADWRERTRERVREAIGLTISPSAPEVDLLGEWQETTAPPQNDDRLRPPQSGAITGRHIRLGFSNGEHAEAYLLHPPETPKPAPAVLLLHDHGSFFSIGKEKLIQRPAAEEDVAHNLLNDDITRWTDRIYGGRAVGNALARHGYVVLCVDALGWGSRRGNGYEGQQALAANLMQFGTSLASVVLQEDLEALDYLAGLPQVDPSRVAVMGYSMGGFRAFQLAALSDRAKACVSGGWMATLHGLMQTGNNQLRGQSAFYMLHPQVAGKLDYPDFAALAAPKPSLFFTGREDRHFPEPSASEALGRLRSLWAEAGGPESIETRLWPGGHVFPIDQQDYAIDWLDRTI